MCYIFCLINLKLYAISSSCAIESKFSDVYISYVSIVLIMCFIQSTLGHKHCTDKDKRKELSAV